MALTPEFLAQVRRLSPDDLARLRAFIDEMADDEELTAADRAEIDRRIEVGFEELRNGRGVPIAMAMARLGLPPRP